MKKQKWLIIIAAILFVCFVAATLFFVFRGIIEHEKEMQYIYEYRADAEEYIRASSEIADKYGDDITVKFSNTTRYSLINHERKTLADLFSQVFNPQAPDTIEEFSANIKDMEFDVEINGDEYTVILENDGNGALVVSRLMPKKAK